MQPLHRLTTSHLGRLSKTRLHMMDIDPLDGAERLRRRFEWTSARTNRRSHPPTWAPSAAIGGAASIDARAPPLWFLLSVEAAENFLIAA